MDNATQKAPTTPRVLSVKEFCARNNIARSTAYEEHQRGRLTIRKVGKKSIITIDDEAAWLSSLPLLHRK
jgi:hypothetical protein